MTDIIKLAAAAGAGFLIFRAWSRWSGSPIRACPEAASAPAEQTSERDKGFMGRLGDRLCWHFLIVVASAVFGFNIVVAVLILALAIPLKLMGVPVDLTGHWPAGVYSGGRETLGDGKEGLLGAIGEAGVPVDGDSPLGWMTPQEADSAWGGSPLPGATEEAMEAEVRAFDALPPERKLALFVPSGRTDKSGLEDGLADFLEPEPCYRIRVGRSTNCIVTEREVRMYRTFWSTDLEGHPPHPKRTLLTSLAASTDEEASGLYKGYFSLLPPRDRLALFDAASRFKPDIPDSIQARIGVRRDDHPHLLRLKAETYGAISEVALDELRAKALGELAEAEPPALAAKWNLADRRLGESANRLKDRASSVGRDVKDGAVDRAEEAKDEAAGRIFWKALGW